METISFYEMLIITMQKKLHPESNGSKEPIPRLTTANSFILLLTAVLFYA
jgi:hypothetical protein